MAKPRILYITEEISPYLPDTPNAQLGRELPTLSQSATGYEVRVFMPRFGLINERRNQLHEVIRLSGINISIADADHPLIIKVASMHPSRIQVYFVDNDDYFQRLDTDVNPIGSNRADNDERLIFYTRGTLETVKKLRWEAQIVNCMGWMSSLSVLYLYRMYDTEPGLDKPLIVYTYMSGQNPDTLDPAIVEKLHDDGFGDNELQQLVSAPSDPNALHRLAMTYADAIVITDSSDTEIVDFARNLGKPVLVLEPEYKPDEIISFYSTLKDR